MRLLPLIACLAACPFIAFAQQKYVYHADIANISNDRLSISLSPPALAEKEAVFSFPRIIPGSYSEKNFGKYIEDFSAFDASGKKLKVKKMNPNQYQIQDADKLSAIRYRANDTWDKPDKDFIFQPGGTNIDAGNNVVMNNHAFFGYFEGYKDLPFEIEINKPPYMYASTHLEVERKSAVTDILKAPNYVYLADNPVFYARPDTTSFVVDNSQIHVSVISATGKVTSQQVATYLQPVANGLSQFFNGLPVPSYQFLFYFESPDNINKKNGGGFGALEHNYSSLYFLPELPYEPRLKSVVLEVASHEFLHILTPLNLHSEEIEDFDFVNPKMSAHLWLYEGVTEYFAQLTQLQAGLLNEEGFFKTLREKITEAEKFGEFSLTTMSSHVLEPAYKDKYSSVYNKGALTALLLDIAIRENTANQKDLKEVIVALSKKYGPGKPFKDDELFDELVAASHPHVREFIERYIKGAEPLPLAEYFAKAGYEFKPVKSVDVYYNGRMGIRFDEVSNGLLFTAVEKKNAIGIEENDRLLKIGGVDVTQKNLEGLWEQYFGKNTKHPAVTIEVERNGVPTTLSGNLLPAQLEIKNYLGALPIPTEAQATMLKNLTKS